MQDVYGVGLKEPKRQSMEAYERYLISFRIFIGLSSFKTFKLAILENSSMDDDGYTPLIKVHAWSMGPRSVSGVGNTTATTWKTSLQNLLFHSQVFNYYSFSFMIRNKDEVFCIGIPISFKWKIYCRRFELSSKPQSLFRVVVLRNVSRKFGDIYAEQIICPV